MRKIIAGLLVASLAGLAPGCGGAHGIETGIPKDVQPPKDFDPGGGVKPDMTEQESRRAKDLIPGRRDPAYEIHGRMGQGKPLWRGVP